MGLALLLAPVRGRHFPGAGLEEEIMVPAEILAVFMGWAVCCWVRQGCYALPSFTAAGGGPGEDARWARERGSPGSAQALH